MREEVERYLDSVFGGLINMLSDNQITLTYTDIVTPVPMGGAAATLSVRNRYVLNRPAATGDYGGTPMFVPADPAPNLLAFPVLDTGRANGGLGGESATMSRSGGWDLQSNRSVGKRYTLRCIDSPGRGFLLVHPTNGNAKPYPSTYIHSAPSAYTSPYRVSNCHYGCQFWWRWTM
mgnify:CR=1 FL=1